MECLIEKYGYKEGLKTVDYEIINWPYDAPKPSREEVIKLFDAWNIKNKHKENRLFEYPEIGDQLDALIKQFEYMRDYNKLFLVPDMTKILNQVTNVKMKYPKEGA